MKSNIYDFYKGLKTISNGIELMPESYIIILAIFLGKGNTTEKASVLFDLGDSEHKGSINKTRFFKMWSDVFRVLVELIQCLARGSPDKGFIELDSLRQYLTKLAQAKKSAIDALEQRMFLPGSMDITREQFINSAERQGEILTSTGFRQFTYKKFTNLKFEAQNLPDSPRKKITEMPRMTKPSGDDAPSDCD